MTTTFVAANTYVHSVTYITDKMLRSLQFIIRESGLDPSKMGEWAVLELGIRTWLASRHLESLVLEVYDPRDNGLINRWDFEILYGYGSDGDGGMWLDTDAIRHAIRKAGLWPSEAAYRLVAVTRPGRPDVSGWGPATLRSTDGFIRHSVGTTIGAIGAGTSTAYWRRI